MSTRRKTNADRTVRITASATTVRRLVPRVARVLTGRSPSWPGQRVVGDGRPSVIAGGRSGSVFCATASAGGTAVVGGGGGAIRELPTFVEPFGSTVESQSAPRPAPSTAPSLSRR